MPDLVRVRLDATMANAEPDQEVQDLLRASAGDNLGMDYLPGSIGLDAPVSMAPGLAADIVSFARGGGGAGARRLARRLPGAGAVDV